MKIDQKCSQVENLWHFLNTSRTASYRRNPSYEIGVRFLSEFLSGSFFLKNIKLCAIANFVGSNPMIFANAGPKYGFFKIWSDFLKSYTCSDRKLKKLSLVNTKKNIICQSICCNKTVFPRFKIILRIFLIKNVEFGLGVFFESKFSEKQYIWVWIYFTKSSNNFSL